MYPPFDGDGRCIVDRIDIGICRTNERQRTAVEHQISRAGESTDSRTEPFEAIHRLDKYFPV